MRLEDQLALDLSREAETLPSDETTALANICRRADRRRRGIRVGLAGAAIALAVLVALSVATGVKSMGGAAGPADRPPSTSRTSSPVLSAAGSRLEGVWQSASIPPSRLRAALAAGGVNRPVLTSLFPGTSPWVVQMTFSTTTGGSAELACVTWSRVHPGASQQRIDLVYQRLPRRGIVVTPPHPTTRWYLSYHLADDRLSLRLTNIRGQLAATAAARLLACTAAPLKLVR